MCEYERGKKRERVRERLVSFLYSIFYWGDNLFVKVPYILRILTLLYILKNFPTRKS